MHRVYDTPGNMPAISTLTRRRVLRVVGATTAGLGASVSGSATATGCPGSDPLHAPRPGPAVLYADPVVPPQLAPSTGWQADPLLVSGSEAYIDGEYLYQGWVYDDHGAVTPTGTLSEQPLVSEIDAPEGDLVYPNNAERYHHNAADILEIRVQPTTDGIRYRIALNTMVEPDAAIIAIGIDTGGGTRTAWGHGLGDLGAPVDHVLVTWGTGAMLDGEELPADAVGVDVDKNQVTLDVELDPGEETWTQYAVAGVHDEDGGFAAVRPQPGPDHPGGAVGDVPPVFDVGFRQHGDEPLRQPATESAISLPTDDPITGTGFSVGVSWREKAQAHALADRDISPFGAAIDFKKLRDRVDERHVPTTGYLNRVYGSRYELGPGIAANETIPTSRVPDADSMTTMLRSRVQPYSVYIPESYDHDASAPAPLHVLLHSLSFNYNQYAGSPNMLQQLGEDRDAIVLMPEGRGPAGWWKAEAELDVFEAWAALADAYAIDFEHVTLGGYSMGGYGTYKLASQYPDLFGGGFAVVGPPDEDLFGGPSDGTLQLGIPRYSADPQNTMQITDNLRHVPLLLWAGTNDELVPYTGVRNYRRQLADHGYRHRLDTFPGIDHLALFALDEWAPGARFLGDGRVEQSPPRVTYRAVPAFDTETEAFTLQHDGAYWVQAIETAAGAADGLVDARWLPAGTRDPVTESFIETGVDPTPHTREGLRWASMHDASGSANVLELDCEAVTAVTLYVDDTGLDVTRSIEVRVATTHPVDVTLTSGAGTETITATPTRSTHQITLCEQGQTGEQPPDRDTGRDGRGPQPTPDPDPDDGLPLPFFE